MGQFEAVVFDLDGTLVDSTAQVLECFREALLPFGLTPSWSDFENLRHRSAGELFTHLLPKDQAEQAELKLRENSLRSVDRVRLLEGIPELLESLKPVPLAIWTGRDSRSAAMILKAHRIEHYFSMVVGRDMVERNKPDPEGLLLIARKIAVAVSDLIHIGDHEHDQIGARAAGCRFGLAAWHETPGSTVSVDQEFRFTRVGALQAWLSGALKQSL